MSRLKAFEPSERSRVPRDSVIQIRASAGTKALLLRAAQRDGRTLSDYVLRAAERDARDALFDSGEWALSQKDFEAVLDLIDNPPLLSPDAIKRLRRKAPWD